MCLWPISHCCRQCHMQRSVMTLLQSWLPSLWFGLWSYISFRTDGLLDCGYACKQGFGGYRNGARRKVNPFSITAAAETEWVKTAGWQATAPYRWHTVRTASTLSAGSAITAWSEQDKPPKHQLQEQNRNKLQRTRWHNNIATAASAAATSSAAVVKASAATTTLATAPPPTTAKCDNSSCWKRRGGKSSKKQRISL